MADSEPLRYAAALALREAQQKGPLPLVSHVEAVAVGRERALREAAYYLRVAAYLDGPHGVPSRSPVHRARGVLGQANACPQCKARPGEPCIFEDVSRHA